MSIPINITKITKNDKTSFLIQIEEKAYRTKTTWQKTYISDVSDLIRLKSQIDSLYQSLTIADRLNITNQEGEKIKEFYKESNLCKTCHLKETNDCIKCVFELQSPLERKLYIELKKNAIYFDVQYGIDYYGKWILTKGKSYDDPENNFRDVLTIPDFYIKKYDLCIYTDGHTYHERTEDQASRDRKIDRKLQELGFKVLRFTGRDINTNIDKVIKEIKKWIEKSENSTRTRINRI